MQKTHPALTAHYTHCKTANRKQSYDTCIQICKNWWKGKMVFPKCSFLQEQKINRLFFCLDVKRSINGVFFLLRHWHSYDGVWNQHVKKCYKSFLTFLRPWHANYFEVYIYSTQPLKRVPSQVLLLKKSKEFKIFIENASNFMWMSMV